MLNDDDEVERARREHVDMMRFVRGLFVAAAVCASVLIVGYRAACAMRGQP